MNSLITNSCTEFAALLAAKVPVPGGGGAAAMAGALGAALCSMVGNYTVGKKKYAAVEEDVKLLLKKADEYREKLLALVDEDARAFEPLSAAYAIPKGDPSGAEILEKATLAACKAPMEMVRCCAAVITLLEEMAEKGSTLMLSDAGCGAILCRSAMECAAMNVFINTGSLKDRAAAETLETEVDGLLSEFVPRADAVAQKVTDRIRK